LYTIKPGKGTAIETNIENGQNLQCSTVRYSGARSLNCAAGQIIDEKRFSFLNVLTTAGSTAVAQNSTLNDILHCNTIKLEYRKHRLIQYAESCAVLH